MNILVTGGAGFVGTNLIKRLVNENHEVYSIDNYDGGDPNNHQPGCMYMNGDLTSIDGFDDWNIAFDVVFHLASRSRIQPSFTEPGLTFWSNVVGTEAVCDWARKRNVKVVYAGSSSRWHDPHNSPYATYKYLGEEICKMYRNTFDMNIEIARFYNVYGPHEIVDGDWAAVMGIWRRQVRDGQAITIVGDGEQRRDFTHVDDIVDGLMRIAFNNERHEDAWELGTGTNYSLNEVYQLFYNRFGTPAKYIPNQKGNYRETLRENTDAIDRLGWKPQDRLKEYINSLT